MAQGEKRRRCFLEEPLDGLEKVGEYETFEGFLDVWENRENIRVTREAEEGSWTAWERGGDGLAAIDGLRSTIRDWAKENEETLLAPFGRGRYAIELGAYRAARDFPLYDSRRPEVPRSAPWSLDNYRVVDTWGEASDAFLVVSDLDGGAVVSSPVVAELERTRPSSLWAVAAHGGAILEKWPNTNVFVSLSIELSGDRFDRTGQFRALYYECSRRSDASFEATVFDFGTTPYDVPARSRVLAAWRRYNVVALRGVDLAPAGAALSTATDFAITDALSDDARRDLLYTLQRCKEPGDILAHLRASLTRTISPAKLQPPSSTRLAPTPLVIDLYDLLRDATADMLCFFTHQLHPDDPAARRVEARDSALGFLVDSIRAYLFSPR